MILRQSENLVLHAEFQTKPDLDIPFRMANYRLRVYRRFLQKEMRQVVIYLKKSTSDLVYQNSFSLSKMRHSFDVIRLWEQPTELFLEAPGLLPFAVLSRTEKAPGVLRQVAQKIDSIRNRRMQSNVAASAAILAGLVLEEKLIQRLLRREIMQDSVIYQQITREAKEEGKREGKREGREEVGINLLRSGMSVEQVVGFTGLSVESIKQLQQQMNVIPDSDDSPS